MASVISEFSLETVTLGASQKQHARVLVGQPHWGPEDWTQEALLYKFSDEDKPRLWLEAFLRKAKETSCDLVLLPELSVPESLTRLIAEWSKQTAAIVVVGSYYHKGKEGYVAKSPIAYGGKVYYVEKIQPAPAEIAPVYGKGLQPGKNLYVFDKSPVGKLGVLICSDYLKDSVKDRVLKEGLDVLCIPAFQTDSSRYHKRIDIDVENDPSGLYVFYANNLLSQVGDGRSAAFAISDNLFRNKLVSEGHADKSCRSMLCRLRDEDDYFIVDLDLLHKRPALGRTVEAKPNLIIHERGRCYNTPSARGPARGGRVDATSHRGQSPISRGFTQDGSAVARPGLATMFSVESEQFIPVFIGQKRARKYIVNTEPLDYFKSGNHERFKVGHNRGTTCYCFPFGVLLLYQREHLRLGSIAELAMRRRQSYKRILDGDRDEFIRLCQPICPDVPERCTPNYVLSLFTLTQHDWKSRRDLDTAMGLLSLPSILVASSADASTETPPDLERAQRLERECFKGGIGNDEICHFGMNKISVGCASWAGVSYHVIDGSRAIPASMITDFEIQLQALWCYADSVRNGLAKRNEKIGGDFGATFLNSAYTRLTTAGPRDSTQLRRMKDAVSRTSHIEGVVEAALDMLQ